SVSYISPTMSRIHSNIFSAKNKGELLGDVAQSITFDGDVAYIVMNNSNMIRIVDRYTFKQIGEITEEMTLPRYAAVANGKLYVNNSGDVMEKGDESNTVYDLESNSFINRIDVDIVTEDIFANDNYLYVGSDPWAIEHNIGIFDLSSEELVNPITLGNKITG